MSILLTVILTAVCVTNSHKSGVKIDGVFTSTDEMQRHNN